MARVEVLSDVTGNVWKLQASAGEQLGEGDVIMILESMKMEVPVEAPVSGRLIELRVGEQDAVAEDEVVAVIESLPD